MRKEIFGCELKFSCPMEWSELDRTNNDSVKFCQECEKNVYRVRTREETIIRAKQGQCVAYIPDDIDLVDSVPGSTLLGDIDLPGDYQYAR